MFNQPPPSGALEVDDSQPSRSGRTNPRTKTRDASLGTRRGHGFSRAGTHLREFGDPGGHGCAPLSDRLGYRDPAFTLRTYAHVFNHHRHGEAFSLDTLLAEPDRTVKG